MNVMLHVSGVGSAKSLPLNGGVRVTLSSKKGSVFQTLPLVSPVNQKFSLFQPIVSPPRHTLDQNTFFPSTLKKTGLALETIALDLVLNSKAEKFQ